MFRIKRDPAKLLGNAVARSIARRLLLNMDVTDSNQRMLRLLKWLPIGFAVSVAILVISLWRAPISIGYLLASAVVGILGWILISFGYSRKHLNAGLTTCMFLLPLGLTLRYFFFSRLDENAASWNVFAQYGAVVYTVIFGFAIIFRSRIMNSLGKHDAEQIVGRERRKRVS